MPTTKASFLKVAGIDEAKYLNFGEDFLDIIKKYAKEIKKVTASASKSGHFPAKPTEPAKSIKTMKL